MRILAAGTKVAPTLATSCAALPPEGALRLWPGKAGSTALAGGGCPPLHFPPLPVRPEPVEGRFSKERCACDPSKPIPSFCLARDSITHAFNALRPVQLVCRIRQAGFTLIELLIVVAIMAIATAGVGLALRDSSGTALEREAQRLAVLLDSARVQSRMSANTVRWRPTSGGFAFEGLPTGTAFPATWLGQDVRVAGNAAVVLGPEPVIGPQQIRLVSISEPARSLVLATDGIRPFAVVTDGAP